LNPNLDSTYINDHICEIGRFYIYRSIVAKYYLSHKERDHPIRMIFL